MGLVWMINSPNPNFGFHGGVVTLLLVTKYIEFMDCIYIEYGIAVPISCLLHHPLEYLVVDLY